MKREREASASFGQNIDPALPSLVTPPSQRRRHDDKKTESDRCECGDVRRLIYEFAFGLRLLFYACMFCVVNALVSTNFVQNNAIEAEKERKREESERPRESPPPRSSNTHSFHHYLLFGGAHTAHNTRPSFVVSLLSTRTLQSNG